MDSEKRIWSWKFIRNWALAHIPPSGDAMNFEVLSQRVWMPLGCCQCPQISGSSRPAIVAQWLPTARKRASPDPSLQLHGFQKRLAQNVLLKKNYQEGKNAKAAVPRTRQSEPGIAL